MHVTSVHRNPAERATVVINWLLPVLGTPTLIGRNFPAEANCMLYVDGTARFTMPGPWTVDGNYLYLAQESPGRVPVFDRLAVLAAIASVTGAISDTRIMEALSTKLVTLIRENTMSIYSSMVVSATPPTRLAVNMANCQVAAELHGQWSLPSGAPAEVDQSWITLDF